MAGYFAGGGEGGGAEGVTGAGVIVDLKSSSNPVVNSFEALESP